MKENADNRKLYTVGEMAKVCNVPARQLRYYDSLGIIQPEIRDEKTGYRYYTEDQISLVLFLYELKSIGISNDSIQRLFINRDVEQLVQELEINMKEAENAIKEAFSRYTRVADALIKNSVGLAYLYGNQAIHSDYGNFKISIVKMPKMRILSTRYKSNWQAGNEREYTKRIVELNGLFDKYHLAPTGTTMSILHHGVFKQFGETDEEIIGDFEIARQIKEDVDIASENIRTFGGFNAVFVINVGTMQEKKNAYKMAKKWASERGIETFDTCIEERWVNPMVTTKDDEKITRLYLPLQEEV